MAYKLALTGHRLTLFPPRLPIRIPRLPLHPDVWDASWLATATTTFGQSIKFCGTQSPRVFGDDCWSLSLSLALAGSLCCCLIRAGGENSCIPMAWEWVLGDDVDLAHVAAT